MNKILLLLGIAFLWSPLIYCGEENAQDSESGLVAHYSFNEGTGNAVKDLSGNGNNGKISGSPKWVTLADDFSVQNFGYALAMNGVVDFGRGPTLDLSGTNLTLEAWFKTGDAKNQACSLINKFATDWKTYHRGYRLCVEENHVRLWLGFGDAAKAFIDTETVLEPNTFYHVIATYDGKFVKIYLNGRMAASIPESRSVDSSLRDTLSTGVREISESNLIDQIKIFNRVLSPEEVNAHYEADKAANQYKPMAGGISASTSPNLLINTAFKRCSNPGIPDWWGTFLAASVKDWEGTYGVDEAMSPPVPGVKCLRIKNPWPAGSTSGFWIGSTFTCFPGKKDYTFSVYLKAEANGLTATIEGGTSSEKNWQAPKKFDLTTDWQRCVVSGYREDPTAMRSLGITISGQGTVWVAAPQMEYGREATAYQPADTETVTADSRSNTDLPTVEAVRIETPPVIDGKLDDACWQKVSKLGNFQRNEPVNVPAQVGTDAWIASDATNLYIALRCHEPEISKLRASEEKRDGAVYGDDSVEIFLSTSPDAKGYYQLATNTLGTRYDAFNQNSSWNADWRCASVKNLEDWSVEFAIPLATLNRTPQETPWRINLCRSRFAGKEPEFSSWSPLKDDSFHTPGRFAWLTGIQVTHSAVPVNQKKADRPALQAMTEYDFYTADQFATLLVDWVPDRSAELAVKVKNARTGEVLDPLKQQVHAPAASISHIQLPLTKLADGLYEITVEALVDGEVLATVTDHFSKMPPNSVEVRMNKPGRYLVVDGKPFFAYGMALYLKWLRYDKKGGANWTKNEVAQDNWQLDDIKGHGFNSMWTPGEGQPGESKKFLDECQRKGLKVLFPVELPGKASYARRKEMTLEIVRRFKDHPAVLAWSFVDEPDLWWDKSSDLKESDLVDLYRAIKEVDPYRPAFINWCFFKSPPYGTLDASDFVSVDRYPLRYSTLTFSPGIVSDLADDINLAAKAVHKPAMFYIQAQGYWDMGREPTPGELRWMSYVNFINGTRLLQYFEYKPMSAQLWESMQTLGEELQSLFRLIATPDARELASGKNGQLIYSLWQCEGNHYLIYANATTKPLVTELDVRALMKKEAQKITPLFGSTDVKLSVNLMFSLQPLQCGACLLQ